MFTNNDNASQVEYENSPSIKFREKFAEFYKSPDLQHFVFWDDLGERVMGVMEMDTGGLSFLTNYENQCHAVHLLGIYVHPDCKGDGLFRAMMENLNQLADMFGVFIYFVARAYLINLPTIKTPEQFTHFLENKDDFFSYYSNKSTERYLSRELGKTYKRFGFCHLVVDSDDVQDRFWRGSVLCSIPENINPELEEAIKGRVYCDETEFVTELKRLGICHNEGSNRRNRKKDKRKRRKSTKRGKSNRR